VLTVAWYRFRTTFRRRWGGYLAILLLVGFLGGIAMGSIAAGRQTGSSFSVYLASTNPSTLDVETIPENGSNGYSAAVTEKIAHLPHVRRVESASLGLSVLPVKPDDTPDPTRAQLRAFELTKVVAVGSLTGLYFDQDRVSVVNGKMADPRSPDEAVMTAEAAHLLGLHLGEVVPLGFYTNEQNHSGKPHLTVDVRIVGFVKFNDAVIQDQVNRFPTDILFTPALTREIIDTGAGISLYGLQLRGGKRYVSDVEQEINHAVPDAELEYHVNSQVANEAEQTIRPEAVALDVFGGIAAFAALLIVSQAIGRQLRERDEDLQILRALGADMKTTASDGLIGIIGSVVLGSVLAVGVAIGLSPLAPFGPVRAVFPSPGIAFDWTVLGLGLAALVGGFGALTVLLAIRATPQRASGQLTPTIPTSSRVARFAATSGLSAPAVTGIRFALESGRGRTSTPVRSALVGAALAVVLAVAAVTFGNSLNTLVSHPALYGWNWNYALQASGGYGDVPLNDVQSLLNHNHLVTASSGAAFLSMELDGQTVPFLLQKPHSAVAPPILSGHGLNDTNEIVVGSSTLAALRKSVGDTVVVSYGTPGDRPAYLAPTRLRIVGTTTLPAIGTPQGLHTSVGTGALAATSLLGAAQQGCNGPSSVTLVQMSKQASSSAIVTSMQATTLAVQKKFLALPSSNGCSRESIALLGVQLPAEIVNYRSMGVTPALLASGVALGAIVALGLTLTASVRRRRRDLALLKTFGFTRRQLAATVAWQSSVAVLIGTIVGVPVGIIIGRLLWDLFAHEVDVVPAPSVPVLSVVLITVGALVLANFVAAFPGRLAARTTTALVLRAE
jgi:ABC-type antimicrobial peptide transport system permease subunit